ncbi:CvpA family protein [Ammoniphilus sp. YIM 78166]|uniref:CvpA family protein n=1 Tax=Ammoniphilus sp. YIM 78166 TaxID=1644106 RepID=UPI00106F3BE7|nr:CvpA family protein [Ammoniphilus sp. YIM 78166]
MNSVDMGLIGLFLISMVYGHYKGFVRLAIGIAGLLASFAIAYSFSQDTAVFLQEQFPLPTDSTNPLFQAFLSMSSFHPFLYMVIAFVVLFFIIRILFRLLGNVLQVFAELPVISFINRSLGAAVGGMMLILLLSASVHFLDRAPDGSWKRWFYQSNIMQYMLQISPFISEQIRMIPEPPTKNVPMDIL